jgi:hypothetical protein
MVTANAFNKHDSLLAGRDPNLDDQYGSITFFEGRGLFYFYLFIIIIYVFVEKVF